MYTIGVKTEVRFWRRDRNRPSRGYPGWSHPQTPGKPVAYLREVSMQRVIPKVMTADRREPSRAFRWM